MRQRTAFTLIELLVIIAIISLLVAILMPSLAKAKEQARGIVCAANERNIGAGMQVYGTEFDQVLPPNFNEDYLVGNSPGMLTCWWFGPVASYLGMPNVSDYSDTMGGFHKWVNDNVASHNTMYLCPNDPKVTSVADSVYRPTSYYGVRNTWNIAWRPYPKHPGMYECGYSGALRYLRPAESVMLAEGAGTDLMGFGLSSCPYLPSASYLACWPGPRNAPSEIGYYEHGTAKSNILFVDGHVIRGGKFPPPYDQKSWDVCAGEDDSLPDKLLTVTYNDTTGNFFTHAYKF